MRLASKRGVGLAEREAFRFFRLRKGIRNFFKYRSGVDKTVLFIVGCQRSGTSMFHHLFRLDWDTVTYDEISPLSIRDPAGGLRLHPLPEVQTRILADRAPLVVCKPLVESQNLDILLDLFPSTRAVWLYRDFRAVALSNLKYFGQETGHRDLAPIIAGDTSNWRAEKLADSDRDIIRDLYSHDMDPYDAAALFWYARNSLFFSRGFDVDSRIMLCRYSNLVIRPAEIMAEAYRFIDRPYPGDRIVADVFSGSKDRGRDLNLSPPVLELCEGMLTRLDDWAESSRRID
ncbi:MAG: hypothetical protein DRR04_13915 [Gammaproteobacteria bacterium]|nr:MAG: hypothetical protein DRR04_13915 [Gammaproteobacteria bacterium]